MSKLVSNAPVTIDIDKVFEIIRWSEIKGTWCLFSKTIGLNGKTFTPFEYIFTVNGQRETGITPEGDGPHIQIQLLAFSVKCVLLYHAKDLRINIISKTIDHERVRLL